MLPKNLPWLRYWAKPEAAQRYEIGGFLQEIDPKDMIYAPDYPQPLDQLRDIPVLILLGEPGMGKTNSLQQEMEALRYSISSDDENFALFDLAEFGSSEDLTSEIFRKSVLGMHRNRDCTFHLFLDSFDECRLDQPNLVKVLLRGLRASSISPPHLQLRIACRSADWAPTLTEGLEEIWGKERIKIYELCPLRRSDVVLAAQVSGINNVELFLKSVHNNELETLASRPKTLSYLIGVFCNEGRLPVSRLGIFEKGIYHLCEESPTRIDAGHGGALTAAQRMLIVGRVAASLVFSNHSGIWAGPSIETPNTDIHLECLVGDEANFFIDRKGLSETLLIAGLTRNLGRYHITFQHRTDAEFLAAWYLKKRDTPVKQILSILRDPKENWIPPQLRETAGWIASMNREVFEVLIEEDPETILVGDIPPDDDLRARLTKNLFRSYLSGECWDAPPRFRLRKLYHNQLSKMLHEVLESTSTHFAARHLALDVIDGCEISEMEDVLIKLIRNESGNSIERISAARVLARIGQKERLQVLLPYAQNEEGIHDPDDEIKGIALQALWPEHLSVIQLFQCLTPRKSQNLLGSYARFLLHYLPNTLNPKHLPFALNWLAVTSEHIKHDYDFKNLINVIMLLAWKHLAIPEILEPFAEIVLIFFRLHKPLFNQKESRKATDPLDDTPRRRILLKALIFRIKDKRDLLNVSWKIVREEDIPWLISLAQGAEKTLHRTIAHVIKHKLSFDAGTLIIESVLEACGCWTKNPDRILRRELRCFVFPVRTKSAQAKKLKEDWEEQIKRATWLKNKEKPKYTREGLIASYLPHAEQGDGDAWVGLIRSLGFEEENQTWLFPGERIENLIGWQEADINIRERIRQAALKALDSLPSPSINKEDKNTYTAGDVAGYVAFELIVENDSCFQFPENVVHKWAHFIIRYHSNAQERRNIILGALHRRIPEFLLNLLMDRIKEDEETPNGFDRIREFEFVWSDAMAERLYQFARNCTPSGITWKGLLSALLRHNHLPTFDYLQAILQDTAADNTVRVETGKLLLFYAPENAWPLIKSIVKSGDDLARSILGRLAEDSSFELPHYRRVLAESDLAILWIAMEKLFPALNFKIRTKVYIPNMQDRIESFKRSILEQIKQAGTENGCRAIQNIVKQFPDREWLKWTYSKAVENTRRALWEPPKVIDLFYLVENYELRLVRTDEELLGVVLESLEKLDILLQGETPLAPFLWDEENRKPKAENRLSEFLKNHLMQDLNARGVLVNREVEIHNWPGKGRGKQTDLLVQAKSAGDYCASLIIETKGCWHADLYKAMDDQLRKDYLERTNYRYGLYLVGWYGEKQCRGISLEVLREKLNHQALAISKDGIKIRSFVLNVAHQFMNK